MKWACIFNTVKLFVQDLCNSFEIKFDFNHDYQYENVYDKKVKLFLLQS